MIATPPESPTGDKPLLHEAHGHAILAIHLSRLECSKTRTTFTASTISVSKQRIRIILFNTLIGVIAHPPLTSHEHLGVFTNM